MFSFNTYTSLVWVENSNDFEITKNLARGQYCIVLEFQVLKSIRDQLWLIVYEWKLFFKRKNMTPNSKIAPRICNPYFYESRQKELFNVCIRICFVSKKFALIFGPFSYKIHSYCTVTIPFGFPQAVKQNISNRKIISF